MKQVYIEEKGNALPYLLHTSAGNKLITGADIVREVSRQIGRGYKPTYRHRETSEKGFLLWSVADGCAVAVVETNGRIKVYTGRQGDFCL